MTGSALALGQPCAEADRHLLHPPARVACAAVQHHDRARQRGKAGDQLADLRVRHRLIDTRSRVGQSSVQVGDQPGALVLREGMRVEADSLAEPQQHRHGQGPLVALDLVEVARRDRDEPGQGGLGQTALFTGPAHLGADEHLHLAETSQSNRSLPLATLH